MAEMRESSVLFSLNQLKHIEQQRLFEEEEALRRRAEAEVAARREAERRAREEREVRARAEEERRRAEELRQRETEARLEAIRLAEIERVRIDAERQQRIAMMEQANEHERKLVMIQQDAQKRRLKRILVWGGAISTALFTTVGGVYFGYIEPEADRIHQQELSELAEREAELARLQAEYDKSMATADELSRKLKDAISESERLNLTRQIQQAQVTASKTKGQIIAVPRGRPAQPAAPCTCEPGDPLCGCIR